MPSDRDDRWRKAVEHGEADRDAQIDSLIAQAAALAEAFQATLTESQNQIRRAIQGEGGHGEPGSA